MTVSNSRSAGAFVVGACSQGATNAFYPMATMTKIHKGLHLGGATHAYMDSLPGAYHRVSFGHDPVLDGARVLVAPDLKFGEFMHHLGCDFLTSTGVPVPVAARMLVRFGVSPRLATEYCTVNLPKLLNGSVCLVVAGMDVWAAFSDAIPHTYLAAGKHAALGALGVMGGVLGKNPLIIASGAAELGVAGATLYRAVTSPIIPLLGVPAKAFVPALARMAPLAAVMAAGGCMALGKSWRETGVAAASAAVGQAASCVAGAAAGGTLASVGTVLGGLTGPAAGLGAFLLCRKLLGAMFPERRDDPPRSATRAWAGAAAPMYAGGGPSSVSAVPPMMFPALRFPDAPLGMLKGGRLFLDPRAFGG